MKQLGKYYVSINANKIIILHINQVISQTPIKEGLNIPLLCNYTTNTTKFNGVDNVIGQTQHHVWSIGMKNRSFSTHKNIIEIAEKRNVALVDSTINHIHEVNLQFENK